jgi:hypothetical protein
MITDFDKLSDEEIEVMLKAPLMVSILIAGADNEIDNSEIKKAVDISKSKQIRARKNLLDFYSEVGENFEDKLKILIQQYPMGSKERNPAIIDELELVNNILPKLDKQFAVEFYESIKDIAKKVAEASGGVLGYMSIGYEESKLVDLKMIKDPATY